MSAKAISTSPHPPVCEPFRAALENSDWESYQQAPDPLWPQGPS